MRLLVAQIGPDARVVGIIRGRDAGGTWVEVEAEARGTRPPAPAAPESDAPQVAPPAFESVLYRRISAVEAAVAQLRTELGPQATPILTVGRTSRRAWRAFGFSAASASTLAAAADGGLAHLTRRFQCAGPLLAEAQRVCLVGPPGAGVTTTAVKLAAHAALVGGRRPAIVQLDCGRLTAVERLAKLAGVLGCPVQTVNSAAALDRALAALTPKHGPLIVDVTGRGVDFDARIEAARRIRGAVLRVAVLPTDASADTYEADWATSLAALRPDQLCLTGLDRVGAGRGLAWAARTPGAPVAWITDGPRIPEDIRLANPQLMAERLLALVPKSARPSMEVSVV